MYRRGPTFGITRVAASLLLAAFIGCGEEGFPSVTTHPVQGRVLLANGQPLTSGRITFLPQDVQTPPASGPIASDGSFALTTKKDGDGAAAGDYKVRIEPASDAKDKRRERRPNFPLKYVDEDSSGLDVTVRAGANRLEPIRLR